MARRDRAWALTGEARPLPASSVVELIQHVTLTRPHDVALESGAVRWTFQELWQHSSAIADAFAESGVGPGDRVAVWAERTAPCIAAMLAAMMVRAAYTPIDPTYPTSRVQRIVAAAGAALIAFDGGSGAGRPPASDVDEFDVADRVRSRSRAAGITALPPTVLPPTVLPPAALPRAGDAAYVIFTSGSTGAPKGVVVEHRSLVNYASWFADRTRRAGAGNALFGSLGFDHTLTSLWPGLSHGRRVVLGRGVWDDAAMFPPGPQRYAFMKVTPSHLRFLERTVRPSYNEHTGMVVLGGEALDPALVRAAASRLAGIRLMNHYGPTEATIGCCSHEFDTTALPALPSVPIGRPIWNTRTYLVDERQRPAPPRRPAELIVAGLGVARGYLGAPTDGRFVDESEVGGPPGRAYRTGDIVELLPDGTLMYLGRQDDQLNVNGYRLELGELRRHVLDVEGVADVAFDLVDGDLTTLEALVVGRDADAIPAQRLAGTVRAALGAALPAAVVPRRVHIVPRLVLTAHGKYDVAATRREFEAARDAGDR
jgi:amino acid adenylation domain-containing protein